LVASWNGFAPDPGRSPQRGPKEVESQLAAQRDQPVEMLGDKAPKYGWHCPVRAAPEDPILADAQWADIARRIMAAAGIAPEGDEEACRWVAVRHAGDHIHIAATPWSARTAADLGGTTTSAPCRGKSAGSKSATSSGG
jgi:hypothetical protein